MTKPDLYWRRQIRRARERGDADELAAVMWRRDLAGVRRGMRALRAAFRVWGERFIEACRVGFASLDEIAALLPDQSLPENIEEPDAV